MEHPSIIARTKVNNFNWSVGMLPEKRIPRIEIIGLIVGRLKYDLEIIIVAMFSLYFKLDIWIFALASKQSLLISARQDIRKQL